MPRLPRTDLSDPFAPIKRTEAHSVLQGLLISYFGINVSLLPAGILSWRPLARYWHDYSPHNYEALYRGRKARDAFHAAHFRRVIREKRTIIGDWGGYSDLYVPVVKGGKCVAHFWSGQFVREPLTRARIDDQWRDYTRQEPSLLSPEYVDFVRVALQTPVFEAEALRAFRAVLELLADWIAEEKDPATVFRQADALRCGAVSDALPNVEWLPSVIRKDRLAWVPWTDQIPEWVIQEVRLTRTPTHVLAVATLPPVGGGEDLVDSMVRDAALRREIFRFGRSLPETFGGEFEGNAILLTSVEHGLRGVQARLRIREKAEALRAWAEKRFRSRVVVGVGGARGIEDIHLSYAEAVSAMHRALEGEGSIVVHGRFGRILASPPGELHRLSTRLTEAIDRRSGPETTAFRARYVEAVLAQARLRPEAARMHLLETALTVLDGAVRRHPDEGRLLRDRSTPWVSRMERSRSLRESLEIFRTLLDECEAFQRRPRSSSRDARLGHVLERIAAECHRSMSLPLAAQWAGMSSSAFTRAIKARTGRNFPEYVARLRVERAKSLLVSGDLPLSQLAQECGFSSTAYFVQVFRKIVGETPARYRARNR